MTTRTPCIRLVRYSPEGVPGGECFEPGVEALREPADGEVCVQVHWLSMDPFPRLCIRGDASAAPQLPLGAVMMGRGAGRVIASRHAEFAVGDWVAGELGWRETAVVGGASLRKVDPALGPVESSLGLLGPSGLTAWFVTQHHAQPRAGETVVVSAAAGSVGSVAVQLARRAGARVVAVVAGEGQARYAIDELSADAALDGLLTGESLARAVDAACPSGVDVFLDGVGGPVHDAVMGRVNVHARVVLYGLLASYGDRAGAFDVGPRHLMTLIQKRVNLRGFLLADHAAEFADALRQLASALREGSLRNAQNVSEGLDSAPAAFAAIFGEVRPGKQLVRIPQS